MQENKEIQITENQKLNISSTDLLSGFQAKQKNGVLIIKPNKINPVNQSSDFWLKLEQVEKIFSACKNLRDRVVIKLMYYGLLRRNEVRSLRIEDCDFNSKTLHLRITKRSKPRSVPIIQNEVWEDLRLLISNRKTGWVFVSKSKDGRLSPKALNDIVGQTAKLAGIEQPNPRLKTMNPHILRHSRARFLRRQNPPIAIEVLQKLLGHSSVKTTMDIYASADLQFISDELNRCQGGQ